MTLNILFRNYYSIALLLGLLLSSHSAFGQLSVNRSVIEFTAKTKVQDIEVLNTGDFKLYLDLKVAEIVNPESENPTRVELSDPRTASVLVSPKQLLVPPGQRKRVRLILREAASDVDRVYRLSVKPYTGKLSLGGSGGDKKSSAIKVLVGYDLLLLSRPQKLNPQVEVNRSPTAIEFKNRGNTNVLLRKITQCEGSQVNCVDLQPNRLYAGETYRIDLPKAGSADRFPVEVWQSVGLSNSHETY